MSEITIQSPFKVNGHAEAACHSVDSCTVSGGYRGSRMLIVFMMTLGFSVFMFEPFSRLNRSGHFNSISSSFVSDESVALISTFKEGALGYQQSPKSFLSI